MNSGYAIPQNVSEQPSLLNSFQTQFSLPVTFIRKGDFVYVTGFLTRTSAPAQSTVILNVSSLFRPSRLIYIACSDATNGMNGRCDLDTNGDLKYIFGQISNTSHYLGFSYTYPLF